MTRPPEVIPLGELVIPPEDGDRGERSGRIDRLDNVVNEVGVLHHDYFPIYMNDGLLQELKPCIRVVSEAR